MHWLSSALFAQRDLKDIPPPDPELERQSFIVADGFEVNLFAADPKIAKPIQMNFDPAGRLWIVSSEIYPHIKPGQKANDKVLVLQDTDGDGTSDKTTVFAEGLLIPTGVEPGDGGAYVGNSTELLHLTDTDGDGRADRTRIVLSGFGTEDTHHIVHTLRWGPAGHLYFNQSIYIHSHIETPYGVKRLNGGGIWQFRPDTLQLDVIMRGMYNSWGHHFDEFGQSFATDGANGEGISYVFPGVAFPAAVGVPRVMHGLNRGSPKHCGLEITSGRHLPEQWRGNVLTNDFRGHRVCRFVVTEDGSGYASREMPELIKTSHVAFRPVDIKMGPDGAIYIADWYNPIIQHGEVDFRDPRRDHTHGRIWRVTYKARPLVKRPTLVDAPLPQLLEELKSPEKWTRQQAKRVLKERGAEVVLPKLANWVAALDVADPLVERHRLEALWVSESLLNVDAQLLEDLLRAKDHRVRAAATRVLGRNPQAIPDVVGALWPQAGDEHPRVRLEAVRALGAARDPRAIKVALSVLAPGEHTGGQRGVVDGRRPAGPPSGRCPSRRANCELDRFLDYALWLTCRELQADWLPRVQSGELTFGGVVEKLAFALRSVGDSSAVAPLVDLVKAGKVPGEKQDDVLAVIADLGGPQPLGFVFDRVVDVDSPTERQVALLRLLVSSSRRRNVRPAGELERIGPLLESENAGVQALAAECAGLWKVQPLRGRLAEIARVDDTAANVRRAALGGLAEFGGPESRRLLVELCGPSQPLSIRVPAVATLAAVDPDGAADRAIDVLAKSTEQDQPGELFAAFLARKQGADVLAKKITLADRTLPADVAKIGLRQIAVSGREYQQLSSAIRKAGGITTGPRTLSETEMQQMIARVRTKGDPHRGESVFRRSELACFKCHAIAGAGGRVGPDLVSIGGSAQIDYLIESLLVPNKKVKENYNTLVVVTKEGKVHTGIKVGESASELVLRDAEDNEVSIPRRTIDERADGASIMPVGLIEKLTDGELVDLVRFLSELGKVGPFQVQAGRIVRRWSVLASTEESRYRIRRTRHARAAADDPAFTWTSAYSTVAGLLPVAGLPEVAANRVRQGAAGTAFVRCELEVTTPGRCRLLLNSPEGLELWLNTTPVALGEEVPLELPTGKHRLTFAVDLSVRTEPLRAEMADVAGSPAVVRVVGGK